LKHRNNEWVENGVNAHRNTSEEQQSAPLVAVDATPNTNNSNTEQVSNSIESE